MKAIVLKALVVAITALFLCGCYPSVGVGFGVGVYQVYQIIMS